MERRRIRLLERLAEVGYDTDKSIAGMTLDDMLCVPNVTLADIALMAELQRGVKEHRVIEFLHGINTNEPKKEESLYEK